MQLGSSPDARRQQPLVLLVEDEEAPYELLSEVLASAGYSVVGAGDGEHAVDAATRLLPDLVIMDLGLPGVDGIEATRRIKLDSRTRTIPILVLTGYVQSKYLDDARLAGCDAILAKPCPIQDLLEEIATHLPQVMASDGQILLVEDDGDLSQSIALALAQEGHPVAVTRDGEEALDYLRRHAPPRVILLDLNMPVMDGWAFREVQKQDPRWSSIPVIVISAIRDRARRERLGATAFLAKPFSLARLQDAVRPYLGD